LKVPSSMTEKEVEIAILFALKDAPKKEYSSEGMQMADDIIGIFLGSAYTGRKYWSYERRGQNVIYSGFHNRSHYLQAEIKYSTNEIQIAIVDSRNMKQDGDRIHKKAPVWLGILEREIRKTIAAIDRYKFEKELSSE